ncbi:MAG TPA: hypothetical protein VJS92_05055 [Candidatus Polarisedimenticolaceae bacterium]|nr:hypothetical protein [Candidatus Polarisedimenticolaceae bacterium]
MRGKRRASGLEVARAAAACAIGLLLLPLWNACGAKDAYRRVVVGIAEWVVLHTQHFPTVASLSNLTPRNTDLVVLVALALLLVSTRVPWPRRLALFGGALAVVLVMQALAFAAWVKLTDAETLQQSEGIAILSPGEHRAVAQLKLVLYDFGLPGMIFALFLLTAAWNSGAWIPEHRPPASRRVRHGLAAVVVAAALAGGFLWQRGRESDPQHVEAHAKIGHRFRAQGDDATAEQQYRLAVAGGTTDPQVYYELAGIAAARLRFDEALRWLGRCTQLTADPAWRARIDKATARVQTARSK